MTTDKTKKGVSFDTLMKVIALQIEPTMAAMTEELHSTPDTLTEYFSAQGHYIELFHRILHVMSGASEEADKDISDPEYFTMMVAGYLRSLHDGISPSAFIIKINQDRTTHIKSLEGKGFEFSFEFINNIVAPKSIDDVETEIEQESGAPSDVILH